MEIKKIKYPYSDDGEGENIWYTFGKGEGAVNIQSPEIEEWVNQTVKQVKEQLEQGVESPYSFIASGNTMVFCFFTQDGDEDNVWDDDNSFTVIVAKNYQEGDFTVKDLTREEDEDIEERKFLKKLFGTNDIDYIKEHYDISITEKGDF